jgi:Protein of unknown function (DUF559)
MDCDLARLAAEQDGLVTRAQAAASGWTPTVVRRRTTTGQWRTVLPGIYLVDDSRRLTTRVWARAAVLRWGRRIVVSHASAAELLGLPVLPTPPGWLDLLGVPADPPRPALTLTVSAARRLTSPPGVRIRRTCYLPTRLVDLAGIPVTSAQRTVLDLLASAPLVTAIAAADAACRAFPSLHQRLIAAVSAAEGSQARQPVPGRRAQGRVMLVDPRAESPLESLLRLLLARHGLPRPLSQAEVATRSGRVIARVDLLFPGPSPLVVEADGRPHQKSWDARADRRRQNALVNAGCRVLRFTWRDVCDRPGDVVALVRSALPGARAARRVAAAR